MLTDKQNDLMDLLVKKIAEKLVTDEIETAKQLSMIQKSANNRKNQLHSGIQHA